METKTCCVSGQPNMSDDQVSELIEAIRQQTGAITRLADSNAALVAAMADAEGADEVDGDEREPDTYLDGTPCARG